MFLTSNPIKPVRRRVCSWGLAASLLSVFSTVTSTVTLVSALSVHPATAQSVTPMPDGRIRSTPAPGLSTAGMTFKQAMNIGYAASRQGDLNTALINFQRALMIQPGNAYAAAAADNMAFYIQYGRVSTRQRAINQLQATLTSAITQKDWVCAATTIDQLTTYTEPGSLNRERLIGQRGEISGLLDARLDHDRWSTVCSAQRPVH